jgi:hypothetical protein
MQKHLAQIGFGKIDMGGCAENAVSFHQGRPHNRHQAPRDQGGLIQRQLLEGPRFVAGDGNGQFGKNSIRRLVKFGCPICVI